jgi:hypothetical protein
MTDQPKALMLADYLTNALELDLTCDEAAAELRRQYEEIEAKDALLLQALEMLEHMPVKHPDQLAQRRKLLNSIEDRLNLTKGS